MHGLGKVTAEYLLMLLGVPGLKADVMILRFVNDALAAAGKLVKAVHAQRFGEQTLPIAGGGTV